MDERSIRLGMKVKHKGAPRFVHSHYLSADGRRIVQLSPHQSAIRGDGVICQNVPLEEIEEEGPGKSSGGPAPV